MDDRWDGQGASLTRGPGNGSAYGVNLPRQPHGAAQPASLAEVLERVLDKGIVIAGDITISLAQVELLQIKVRLLIASVDKAQEMGINWWQADPALSARARHLEDENRQLRERLDRLESRLPPGPVPPFAPQSPATPSIPPFPRPSQPEQKPRHQAAGGSSQGA